MDTMTDTQQERKENAASAQEEKEEQAQKRESTEKNADRKERKELPKKKDALQKEIFLLREKLNEANEKKEKAYAEKAKVSTRIRSLISQIKSSRSSRDTITGDVKAQKMERRRLNEQIRRKIEEIKKVNAKKHELLGKQRIKTTPARLKRDIDHLELRVETEALSPDEEKKVMAKIKELKRTYSQLSETSGVFDEYKRLSKEIDALRASADAVHAKIQDEACSSQEQHEALIGISKEIDELRKAEKEKNETFMKLKEEFNSINEALKEKLLELRPLQKALGEKVEEEQKARKKKQERSLREKEREVEEKIARGEKLTTEDLLLMQRNG